MNIRKRIREILHSESTAIEAIRVTKAYEIAVLALRDTEGKVLATGIGKSGYAANKFAATLCSTGTPAAFLHPSEALHGDLGLIGPGDSIVAFSTSGKSEELIELLPHARRLAKIKTIIGITSHPDSKLRQQCDIILDMGNVQEPCSLRLTPTASTIVMQAIGDAIALSLMEIKGITREDYALRHQRGSLGRKARSANF